MNTVGGDAAAAAAHLFLDLLHASWKQRVKIHYSMIHSSDRCLHNVMVAAALNPQRRLSRYLGTEGLLFLFGLKTER